MSITLDDGLTLQIGDHSYIHDARIRNPSGALTDIRIGKYCSIATELTIIGYDHHTDWVSMYPFLDDGNRVLWEGTEGIPYPQEARFGSNKSRGDIEIGHDVWIGYGVKLFKGITIGNGAVIGACSLVTRSVPPYTLVAGIPAKPLRQRFTDPEIEILQRIQWWDWPKDKINRYMSYLCSSRVLELDERLRVETAGTECLGRADAAYARGDLAGACEALCAGLAMVPDSTEMLVCLGNIRFQAGDAAGAVDAFSQACRLQPRNPDFQIRLANAAWQQGNTKLGRSAVEKALQLDPQNQNALRALANQRFDSGNYIQAAEDFCGLLSRFPEDKGLLLQLGLALRELKDFGSARWCLERLRRLQPEDGLAAKALASLPPESRKPVAGAPVLAVA